VHFRKLLGTQTISSLILNVVKAFYSQTDRPTLQASWRLMTTAGRSPTGCDGCPALGIINSLAARHRTPAIYPYRYFAREADLSVTARTRGAAIYLDRLLKDGETGRLAGSDADEV
jgi:hypothetical protein